MTNDQLIVILMSLQKKIAGLHGTLLAMIIRLLKKL
jgi:hypothetical protein